MRKGIKELWVNDLRTVDPGVQGKGALTRIDIINGEKVMTDCCLGRLTKLAVARFDMPSLYSEVRDVGGRGHNLTNVIVYDGEWGCLPHSVRDWADMDGQSPTIYLLSWFVKGHPYYDYIRDWILSDPVRNHQIVLADLNDSGLTFQQIADVIDYFWEAL